MTTFTFIMLFKQVLKVIEAVAHIINDYEKDLLLNYVMDDLSYEDELKVLGNRKIGLYHNVKRERCKQMYRLIGALEVFNEALEEYIERGTATNNENKAVVAEKARNAIKYRLCHHNLYDDVLERTYIFLQIDDSKDDDYNYDIYKKYIHNEMKHTEN